VVALGDLGVMDPGKWSVDRHLDTHPAARAGRPWRRTTPRYQPPSCVVAFVLLVDPMVALRLASAVRVHLQATSAERSVAPADPVPSSAEDSAGPAYRPRTSVRTSVVSAHRRSGGGSAHAETWALTFEG
jgi:hypothetical protein